MRNGHSLFTDQSIQEMQPAARKGRNAGLLARRDDLLLHRYVYYAIHTDLRPEKVHEQLQAEFHLTQRHFLAIIYARAADVRIIRQQAPTITQLRSRYPHLMWVAMKA